jgi:CxxC motif-containing protein (DUF1111 family)
LTQQQIAAFNQGQQVFVRNEGPPTGLGPVFNGTSCVNCHQAAAPGGASANLGVSVVTRIGAIVNGNYSDLTEFGGPVLQARSLRQFDPRYPIPGEIVPSQAQFVSRRLTTPVFGAGLIELIPDSAILDLEATTQPDGVQGVANRVIDPETGDTRIGRFGWKAQHATLAGFTADAYLNEMGITTPLFPHENLPQGNPIPPGADTVPDPEDEGTDAESITTFMRLLAAPRPAAMRDRKGIGVFHTIKCNACHVPTLRTGTSPIAALSEQNVSLYSDLLLHRMGPELADGIRQGTAQGDQWRTAPLWGLSTRPFLLHDGRATTVDEAIRMHGGEGSASRDRYIGLSEADRTRLLNFLRSL